MYFFFFYLLCVFIFLYSNVFLKNTIYDDDQVDHILRSRQSCCRAPWARIIIQCQEGFTSLKKIRNSYNYLYINYGELEF